MAYQIVDNGSSIFVFADHGELLIMKRSIQRISIVRDNIIEINTGGPLQNIFFRYEEVFAPQMPSAIELRDYINGLIAE